MAKRTSACIPRTTSTSRATAASKSCSSPTRAEPPLLFSDERGRASGPFCVYTAKLEGAYRGDKTMKAMALLVGALALAGFGSVSALAADWSTANTVRVAQDDGDEDADENTDEGSEANSDQGGDNPDVVP